jgi:hypothetical protein
MAKRILRVTKWIGTTPAVAVCAACGRQFALPVTALKSVVEARAKMQALFDGHKCEPGSGEAAGETIKSI